jgi:hypothetical protein
MLVLEQVPCFSLFHSLVVFHVFGEYERIHLLVSSLFFMHLRGARRAGDTADLTRSLQGSGKDARRRYHAYFGGVVACSENEMLVVSRLLLEKPMSSILSQNCWCALLHGKDMLATSNHCYFRLDLESET